MYQGFQRIRQERIIMHHKIAIDKMKLSILFGSRSKKAQRMRTKDDRIQRYEQQMVELFFMHMRTHSPQRNYV